MGIERIRLSKGRDLSRSHQPCSPFLPFPSWLCQREARWRIGVCWRTSLMTWRGNSSTQTTSTATKCTMQSHQPLREIFTKMAALRILKTTLNSHKSIRRLKTACVTPNTCLHVPSQNSRTEDFPSLRVSHLLRSQESLSHWGKAVHRSQEGNGLLDNPDQHHGQHEQAQQKKDGRIPASPQSYIATTTQVQWYMGGQNISTICSESRF